MDEVVIYDRMSLAVMCACGYQHKAKKHIEMKVEMIEWVYQNPNQCFGF